MGMTIAEKILAAKSHQDTVKPNDFITASIDVLMFHECFYLTNQIFVENGIPGGIPHVWDKNKIAIILDHFAPPMNRNTTMANRHAKIRELVARLELKHFYDVGNGICHQVLPESGLITPGKLVVVPDSHATLYGALNIAGTGIGETEAAYILLTGELWFVVPPSIRINVEGKLPPHISGKDIFLEVIRRFGTEVAQYKSIEWCGSAINELSMDDRMCISNQSVELGAKFSFFNGDEKTTAFLKQHGVENPQFVFADTDAVYEAEYEVDVTQLLPMVACPHGFKEVLPASQLGHVRLDQTVIGGCANGRLEDIAIASKILAGHKVAKGTRLIVTPASKEIYQEAMDAGYLQILSEAGAIITNTCCGPCIGVIATLGDGEICLTSTSRNFKGRMGNPEGIIYLASPAVVAASSIKGTIVDPGEVI